MSWCAMAVSTASASFLELHGKHEPLPNFGQCSYCKRLPDINQTHSNCTSCGAALPRSTEQTTMNYSNHDSRTEDEARKKRQRQQEEEDQRKRSEESSRQSMNIAMGDMLGTGIPGGIDMDITTPL